jgi:hypothetical protein
MPRADEKTMQPGSPRGYGRRIKQAILELQARALAVGMREPSYDDIGRWIARVEGRAKPYVSATLSSWIQERTQPKFEACAAMAVVFKQRDASWIILAIDEARYAPEDAAHWSLFHEHGHLFAAKGARVIEPRPYEARRVSPAKAQPAEEPRRKRSSKRA